MPLRKIRYKLLAGLLDTDGHLDYGHSQNGGERCVYQFSQVRKHLTEQTRKLALSLGLTVTEIYEEEKTPKEGGTYKDGQTVHIHYRIAIGGKNMLKIPCLIERKKAGSRCVDHFFYDCLTSRIKVTPITEYQGRKCDQYVSIAIDGNQHFLLEDCTVVNGYNKIL